MRDYGKVHTGFWASDTLRSVGTDAKLLALYLLTSPHTHQAGAFRLPDAYASDDLGWDAARLQTAFGELQDAGWLKRCQKTGWVWVVNFARFNPPDNPNQRKAVEKQLASVPANCVFAADLGTVSEPFEKGSVNRCDNGSYPVPVPVPVPSPVPVVAREDELFPGVDPQVVADFRALRKAKKAAITATAVAGIKREADKAGLTLESALRVCCERGWTGFSASWQGAGATPPAAGPAKRRALL